VKSDNVREENYKRCPVLKDKRIHFCACTVCPVSECVIDAKLSKEDMMLLEAHAILIKKISEASESEYDFKKRMEYIWRTR
jgi:hypothetical protein